jgi:hypothetical protein
LSKPHDGTKYLDNVVPRSKKHPRIMYFSVYGGTTASGWHSYKEKPPERESTQE